MVAHTHYDAVIVGGGHNGLVAAAYLAGAGRRVLVLERLAHTGGAAVSAAPFAGVGARLSRYSYLVSLLPRKIVHDLGLRVALRRRPVSSYTPAVRQGRPTGLLVSEDASATRESFVRLTGSDREFASWQRFHAMTQRLAGRVFPTLTGPLPSRAELRRRVDDEEAWRALFERPLSETVEAAFDDDLVRGVVLTDALIGTFATADDPSLRQNRCFLYHVIGGGTGDWHVPVGGMGAVTEALHGAARGAGAEIVTGHEVTALDPDVRRVEVRYRNGDRTGTVSGDTVLVNAAPRELSRLLGEEPGPVDEGAQFKVNMVLRRLPRPADPAVDAPTAFGGTFHVGEGYRELAAAHREAAAGRLPQAPPAEIYCHTLTDPSILDPGLAAGGAHTLTLFGLHTPAALFRRDNAGTRRELLAATLARVESYLAEPLTELLATDAEGRPCLEAKTPLDLERELRLPGGNIFHRDLSFPFAAEEATDAEVAAEGAAAAGHASTGQVAATDCPTGARWGVATHHPRVLLCGAGAVRGGGVSGVPGHNAAMAVLGR